MVEVEGRAYPVEVRWRPLEGEGRRAPASARIATHADRRRRADEITRDDPRGDVLVFLPGEREIRDAHLALSRRKYRETEVLPLYARLSAATRTACSSPARKRRIVLATNVAETSLTVPRIRYVVDTGTARVKRYSPRSQLERLHIEPISQASADQRKGRCGRVGPGICYRLYARSGFRRSRRASPIRKSLRSSLAGVILRMLALGLGRIEDFPFLEPPDPRAVADGWQQSGRTRRDRRRSASSRRSAARWRDCRSTCKLGAHAGRGARARLPARDARSIAAFLGIQDPRERPADARAAADAAHAAVRRPGIRFRRRAEAVGAYNAAHEELTQSKLRDWCERISSASCACASGASCIGSCCWLSPNSIGRWTRNSLFSLANNGSPLPRSPVMGERAGVRGHSSHQVAKKQQLARKPAAAAAVAATP